MARRKQAITQRDFSLGVLNEDFLEGDDLDAAGHTCVAVVGPNGSIARTLRTGSGDRVANMRAFAAEALKLLDEQLS